MERAATKAVAPVGREWHAYVVAELRLRIGTIVAPEQALVVRALDLRFEKVAASAPVAVVSVSVGASAGARGVGLR